MKNTFYAIIMMCCFAAVSCESDDIPSNPLQDNSDEFILPDSIRNRFLTEDLLGTLCYVDTINDSTFSYRAKYGRQDETDPTVFLFNSTSPTKAYSFFKHLVPSNEVDKIVESENTSSYSIDEERTVKYTYIGDTDVEAIIEFDFPEIPQIKKYVYIPTAAWPYNANLITPFKIGTVWERTLNSQKWTYVCVKEYDGDNDKGIMMTFSGGWNQNGQVSNNCASKAAWQAFEDLCTANYSRFENAVAIGAIPTKFVDGNAYGVGSIDYKTWTTGFWFWKETHTQTIIHQVKIKNDRTGFTFNDINDVNTTILGSSHIIFGREKPTQNGEIWKQLSL